MEHLAEIGQVPTFMLFQCLQTNKIFNIVSREKRKNAFLYNHFQHLEMRKVASVNTFLEEMNYNKISC